MKPTKNRNYCKDCGRIKMLFETEKKADTFIKFNSLEIETEAGYSPTRSYFCIACNGWHITSKSENINIKSKTEKIVESYHLDKERNKTEKKEAEKIRKNKKAEALKCVENLIKILEIDTKSDNSNYYTAILNKAFEEIKIAKKFSSKMKQIGQIEEKLNNLRKEFENNKMI